MATAQSLMQTSYELLGVYAPSEVLSAADSARGLQVLNAMMDSWSNESLTCFAIQEYSFPMVVGQQTYTIGIGGQINIQRPLRVIDGPGAAYVRDTNLNNYPMNVIPRDRWNQIGQRSTTSNLPDTFFYDNQYPLGVINIFPVPLSTYTVFFDAYLQLTDFSNLTSPLSLPPGYEAAIYTNLAIWLKPFFTNVQLDQTIIELASVTKGIIKRNNIRPAVAVYDSEIVSNSSSTYNIYSDRGGTP